MSSGRDPLQPPPTLDSFVGFLIERGVLDFGEFTLKSGRKSPYFFNLGRIDDGRGLAVLGAAYAAALVERGDVPDVLFGPAYKGIPLAVATGVALHQQHGIDVGVAYNRKEAKDHGEGGVLVGAPLAGRVTIVDDVMTAGTAVAESAELVRRAGARLHSTLVALDRQEIVADGISAVQQMASRLDAPVHAIATLLDVISYLDSTSRYTDALASIRSYQLKYCVMPELPDDGR